jgi:hypothetical protein
LLSTRNTYAFQAIKYESKPFPFELSNVLKNLKDFSYFAIQCVYQKWAIMQLILITNYRIKKCLFDLLYWWQICVITDGEG